MSAALTISAGLKKTHVLERNSDSARLDVEVLLAAALQKDRSYLYTWPEKQLTPTQSNTFVDFLQRREQGEPIAYIVGAKEFWSLSLMVNESTLIPRPETETLVETALALFTEDDALCQRRVIDLGTGTGAIALALASEKSHWDIIAVDNSQAACDLAEKNRQYHQLNNVKVIYSHWLQAIAAPLKGPLVDMIVTNPPYIDQNDPHLSQGDVRFEPHSALTAANHGLADIEMIATQSVKQLLPNGWLLIEHGYQQADAVKKILSENDFQQCSTLRDMAGHPRLTIGQLSA
ncbi:MAG: release factor glutamine methyltransferase [Kiritimatiellia bacterium]|jgi:release factor glutamine methyltransferase